MKIFCASSGRCGTAFISEVFRKYTSIGENAFHEPDPRGIGRTMEEVNQNAISSITKAVITEKIRLIGKYENYFESSQTFIKTFVWDILGSFDDVYCIYVERNLIDIIFSYFKQSGDYKPKEWLLRPEWPRNIIKGIGCRKELSWYELLLFNWFEVRERFLFFKSSFVKTFTLSFEELNDCSAWQNMFDHFGVEYKEPLVFDNLYKNGSTTNISCDEMLEKLRQTWSELSRTSGFYEDAKFLTGEI